MPRGNQGRTEAIELIGPPAVRFALIELLYQRLGQMGSTPGLLLFQKVYRGGLPQNRLAQEDRDSGVRDLPFGKVERYTPAHAAALQCGGAYQGRWSSAQS